MPTFAQDQTEATKQLLQTIQPRLAEMAASYDKTKWTPTERNLLNAEMRKRQEQQRAQKIRSSKTPLDTGSEKLRSAFNVLVDQGETSFRGYFPNIDHKDAKTNYLNILPSDPNFRSWADSFERFKKNVIDQHPLSFTKDEREALRSTPSNQLFESLRKDVLSEKLKEVMPGTSANERRTIAGSLLDFRNKNKGFEFNDADLNLVKDYYEGKKVDDKQYKDLEVRIPSESLFDLQLQLSPSTRGSVPETEDARELFKAGINVFDPKVQATLSKDLSPVEIVAGMEGKRGEGAMKHLNRYMAFQQARKKATDRGEEPLDYPSVLETRVENPHEYQGERVSPFSDQTQKSFEEGEALRNLSKEIEEKRKAREEGILNKLKDIGTTKDVINKYHPALANQQEDFKKFYDKEMGDFQRHQSYKDSPYYKDVVSDTDNLYDLLRKKEDKSFNESVLPRLRGRFASAGALNSSAYQNALRRAQNEHEERLMNQHAMMFDRARQEGVRHHEWGQQNRLKGLDQFGNSLNSHMDRAVKQMQTETEQQRLDRLRLAEDEKTRQDMEQRQLTHRLGLQTSLEGEGKKREDQLQKEIEARMKAHQERPGGPIDMSAVTHMLNAAAGIPGQPMPLPSTYPTVIPPISASASNAALLAGTAAHLGQMMGHPAQQQQMQQQVRQPAGYAAGGHVTGDNSYRNMMDRYLSQLEQFNRAKEEHDARPIPLGNPAFSALSDVAAGIGDTLGTGRSSLGGWSKGIQDGTKRFDDYAQKKHDMSKERVAMEDLLSKHRKEASTLQSDRERYEEEARHHKASEDLASRRFKELSAYEKAKLDLDEKKYEMEGSRKKELTDKQRKGITDSEHGLKGSMDMLAQSVLLRNIAPYVKTGSLAQYSPGNWESLSDENRLFGSLAKSFALDKIQDFGGVRSNFIAKTVMENKMGNHLGQEDNIALSRNISKGTREASEGFVKDALRQGLSVDEMLEDLEEKNISTKNQIAMQGLEFKKTKGWNEEKYNKWLQGALADWEEQYKDIERHVKKKILNKGDGDDHLDVSKKDEEEIAFLLSKGRDPFSKPYSEKTYGSDAEEKQYFPVDDSVPLSAQNQQTNEIGAPNAPENLDAQDDSFTSRALEAIQSAPIRTARLLSSLGTGVVAGVEAIPATALSWATGKEYGLAPTLRRASEKYLGKPEEKSAEDYINRGFEAAGEFAGLTPYGAMIGAGKGATSLAKGARYLGDEFLGGRALKEAIAGSPESLALGVKATVPLATTINYLTDEIHLDPYTSMGVAVLATMAGAKGLQATKFAGTIGKDIATGKTTLGDVFKDAGIKLEKLSPFSASGKEKEFARNLRDIVGEENLDQVIHNIKTYEAPFEGYKASTAEKAFRPGEHGASGLAAVERSIEGHMPKTAKLQSERQQAVKDIYKEAYPEYSSSSKAHDLIQKEFMGDKELLADAVGRMEPGQYQLLEDVGLTIGDETRELVKKLRKKRKKVTEPLYDEIKESAHLVENPEHTDALLKELSIDGMPDAVKGRFGNLVDLISTEGRIPTAGRLESERQAIRRRYANAMDAGDYQDALFFKKMMTALENDIASVEPLAAKARNLYRKLSEPIGKIVDNSYLSKPLKKKGGEQKYTDTYVGSQYTQGRESREKVKRLRESVGEGQHMESLSDYAAQKALEDLYDVESCVFKKGKTKEWFDKHPGLLEANPTLRENIEELKELQAILEGKAGRKAGGKEDIFAKESEPSKFISKTLNADDRTAVVKEIIERLKRLGGEEGVQSYLSGVLDHMYDTITINGSKNITHDKFNRYMRTYGDILKNNLSKEQYSIIDGMRKAIDIQHFTSSAGRGTNSHTKHLDELVKKLYENDGKDWARKISAMVVAKIPFAKNASKIFGDDIATYIKDIRKRMGDKFVTDEAFALKLLERAKDLSSDERNSMLKTYSTRGYGSALRSNKYRVSYPLSDEEEEVDNHE